MIIDGRQIRDELLAEVRKECHAAETPLSLGIFVSTTPDFATESFVRIKKKAAETIGVRIVEYPIDQHATTESVISDIQRFADDHDGLIVQCPLPVHLDLNQIRNVVPVEKDVDALSDSAIVLSKEGKGVLTPVVGAIHEISTRTNLTISGKKAVVVGNGRLVGQPAASYLSSQGAEVIVLDKHSPDRTPVQDADILVLGAGVPGLITPEMIKEGVALFDAGTSEAEGKLTGDADPACAEKCSIFTPVPGGIGPITVALIFKNLLTLAKVAQQ